MRRAGALALRNSSRMARRHRKSVTCGNGSAENWRRSMSAKKRTSLDAVFATEELPAPKPPKKTDAKTKPVETARPTVVAMKPQERVGGSKRHSVKQHTAYLPLAVHEQL